MFLLREYVFILSHELFRRYTCITTIDSSRLCCVGDMKKPLNYFFLCMIFSIGLSAAEEPDFSRHTELVDLLQDQPEWSRACRVVKLALSAAEKGESLQLQEERWARAAELLAKVGGKFSPARELRLLCGKEEERLKKKRRLRRLYAIGGTIGGAGLLAFLWAKKNARMRRFDYGEDSSRVVPYQSSVGVADEVRAASYRPSTESVRSTSRWQESAVTFPQSSSSSYGASRSQQAIDRPQNVSQTASSTSNATLLDNSRNAVNVRGQGSTGALPESSPLSFAAWRRLQRPTDYPLNVSQTRSFTSNTTPLNNSRNALSARGQAATVTFPDRPLNVSQAVSSTSNTTALNAVSPPTGALPESSPLSYAALRRLQWLTDRRLNASQTASSRSNITPFTVQDNFPRLVSSTTMPARVIRPLSSGVDVDDSWFKLIEKSEPTPGAARETNVYCRLEDAAVAAGPCCLCLDNYKAGDSVAFCSTSEKHVLHTACALEWLEQRNECPLCRAVFCSPGEQISCIIYPDVAALATRD